MTQANPDAHSDAMKPVSDRKALRKALLSARKSVAAEQRRIWDAQIAEGLMRWLQQRQPSSLAVYWPIQAEPDLRDWYPQITAMGIQLALPWVVEKNAPLKFLAWQQGDAMELDEYGIPLPADKEKLIEPEILLVPCVGFNQQAYRLGYGGGFYDRTLAQLTSALPLGIAYELASTVFEPGEFDLPMSGILTESGLR
ncbi:5-formyltetrahydrofolate cyclo-ligase [Undibacterium squillarum]|uniref:5-formyltetrahydrofolate cyclo-ligase n=2 Tax=Undibacterium squillarum TaxID=1131567 RepID=A0ABQ2Y0R1_9BURK|nr:5-formyltetrahydrofolate cyclo-ligase [Undibacterium squillarum]